MAEKINCFIECLLPITVCNLKCHYCYIVQRNNRMMRPAQLQYPVNTMARSLRKERLGGTAYISICGAGETMMQRELPELIQALLNEGHYVNVTTNGTVSSVFTQILNYPPPRNDCNLLEHLNFSFSLHYIELKQKGWINRFFDNVERVRKAGCSVVIQMNLCDEYEQYFDEIKRLCLEHVGALPQLAATRDEINLHKNIHLFTQHSQDEYMAKGEEFDSPLFRFTMQNFMVKRHEFCYAGRWSYVLDLATGIMKPCYASQIRQNIFAHPDSPIRMTAVGQHCRSPFCMNSSHFISMGVIPSLLAPTYADLRNRLCKDGTEWYNSTMKEALSRKLYDNNPSNINMATVRQQAMKDTLLSAIAMIVPKRLKDKIKRIVIKRTNR